MRKGTMNKLSLAAVVASCVLPIPVQADYEVYNANDTKLDLQLTVVGAQFGQNEPWWGAEHSFLNVSANHWTEFGTTFGAKFDSKLWGGDLFGQASGVYTRSSGDDPSGLTEGLGHESQTTLEQANLGWKTTESFSSLGDTTISAQLGRFNYTIGSGMLIWDGGGDGGDRGGWYIGMRKAFQNGGLISLDSNDLKVQIFRLKNNPRRGGAQGEGRGVNADYTIGDSGVVVGGTVMRVYRESSNEDIDVYDGRASWAAWKGLTFSGEYAHEDGSNSGTDGTGYYVQADYAFGDVAWKPTLTYRYALFNDEFNTLAYGYSDYSSWYQGEIAGNYPLTNINLKSNMVRAKIKPTETIVMNLIYYNFKIDSLNQFNNTYGGSPITSDNFGNEIDLTFDWQATDRFLITTVFGDLIAGDGARQWVGASNGNDWLYAMLMVTFTL